VDWSSLLIGLALTVLGAVIGALITGVMTLKSTERQTEADRTLASIALAEDRRAALAQRTSEYLAATHHGVLSLRDYAMAGVEDKRAFEKSEVWPTVDRVNRTLVAIQVSDIDHVVEAARKIDEAMVDLSQLATLKRYSREEWSELRDARWGGLDDALIRAARAQADALLEAGKRGSQA
jgi:hypothetical protein